MSMTMPTHISVRVPNDLPGLVAAVKQIITILNVYMYREKASAKGIFDQTRGALRSAEGGRVLCADGGGLLTGAVVDGAAISYQTGAPVLLADGGRMLVADGRDQLAADAAEAESALLGTRSPLSPVMFHLSNQAATAAGSIIAAETGASTGVA